ncbi:GNAT family N-acetyltransferase [Streptomyces sp. MZ04]|uniref:GNAT family N-acetyltransferase n=1 Tax=Streptomyces sp. MZ04 TaxID=2559236 RepID=UPI00107ED04E|nr:GNAT family N-acetyltransferase [Streptomyces sp. MZ04]TGB10441.1 GNAT family N-acetyltransferase [Streptomyces sp. MZ04]
MSPARDLRIRPRRASDLDACARALAQVHALDGYPTDWPERPADWLATADPVGAWVAELDGRIAGHIVLCPSEPDDVAPELWGKRGSGEAAAVVSRLFVAPEARGHGIGARLLERVVAEAGELALHPVLDVVASDTSATALYERTGWRFLGTGEQHWGPRRSVTVRCYAAPAPSAAGRS